MKDKKSLFLNTFIPLLSQVIAMFCGFILPRSILTTFGSEINGATSSILQFLSIINFFDLGVTAVLQSALYKPLAEGNQKLLSETVSSADKFFSKIGRILVIYILGLCFVIPFVSDGSFSFLFWVTLIIAMGINSFGQYYLGVVNRIILISDQKLYLTSIVQTIVIILNTVISLLLINLGANIQVVKFISSLVFLLRPLFYSLYVKRHYKINRKVEYESEPLKQRWNGVAQHICAVVLEGTDVIVLTIMSSLKNVSIYQMYFLVVAAVKTLLISMANAIPPYIGKLWAQNRFDDVKKVHKYYEWFISALTIFAFGCTASLIVPFIMIYTKGVTDANYYQPLFAILLTISVALYCLRLPYTSMINATGKYRETQHIYIAATIINIVLSLVFVNFFGLIGVTIGTVVSLGYQTIHLSIYCLRKILNSSLKSTIGLWVTDSLLFSAGYFIVKSFNLNASDYSTWIIHALIVASIWFILSIVTWIIIKRDYLKQLVIFLVRRIRK